MIMAALLFVGGALTSLIDQYDGLKIGFELSRVK